MSESGLRKLWETVYAHNSVNRMLTRHAYARALRAHMLSAAVLTGQLLQASDCLNERHLQTLASVHDMLLSHNFVPKELYKENALIQLSNIIDDIQRKEALSSRTGKLWIEYIRMVRLLLLFIRAELTADWELHLYCITKMMPSC